jgi:hypothetical protein
MDSVKPIERPLLAQSGHSVERRDQAKPNYIAISIHMSSQVYSCHHSE